MKKKWIAALFGALVLAGCGNAAAGSLASSAVSAEESSSAAESSSASSSAVSEPKAPEMELIGAGDTVKTDSCEVTVNSVSFSYDVLPEYKSSFYTHYPADKGKVYIDVDVDVKNLQKQALPCDEVMEVDADYNDGYAYSGMAVVEDATGFTYSNITAIDPLETKAMRYLVDCPQEVEETDYPLFLVFKIDGQSFKYVMRGEGAQPLEQASSSEAAPVPEKNQAAGQAAAPAAQPPVQQVAPPAASSSVPQQSTPSTANEDTGYLRELAELDAINRYTGAEIRIEMDGVTDSMDSHEDIDGMTHYNEGGIYDDPRYNTADEEDET